MFRILLIIVLNKMIREMINALLNVEYHFSKTSIIITLLAFIAIITYLVVENLYSKQFVKAMQDKLKDLSSTEASLTDLRQK